MPTYDYRCDACGHQFELFQSIKADPAKTCPSCGADSARRVIGAGGGLIFKGSGFYITDYRSKGYQERAKSDSSSGGASQGGASSGGSSPTSSGGTAGGGAAGGSSSGGGSSGGSKPGAAA